MHAQKVYPIRDPGDVGEARRAAVGLAWGSGFDDTDQGKVALVVTEAGTNILKHGRVGQIILGTFVAGADMGVELIALDKGPGMVDVARSLQDGYSTAGSSGTGLGAMTRLASEFDIYSAPGAGTAIVARLLGAGRSLGPSGGRLEVGGVCLPMEGEALPGDGWELRHEPDRAVALVVDGLGHGPLAARAAGEAVQAFSRSAGEPPERIVERLHDAIRITRGAAVAVADARWSERRIRFCGVGNISAGIYTPQGSRSFVSQNGIVGLEIRRIQAFDYDWPERSHLIMHSDGLTTRWDLRGYPGLLARDPSLIAGVLYRDHARGRDDVTVLVAREREVTA